LEGQCDEATVLIVDPPRKGIKYSIDILCLVMLMLMMIIIIMIIMVMFYTTCPGLDQGVLQLITGRHPSKTAAGKKYWR